MRAGVAAVWLIDVPARTVQVHEAPGAGAYGTSRIASPADQLQAPVEGIDPIAVAELFAVLDR